MLRSGIAQNSQTKASEQVNSMKEGCSVGTFLHKNQKTEICCHLQTKTARNLRFCQMNFAKNLTICLNLIRVYQTALKQVCE
jgi:hypothetical protein